MNQKHTVNGVEFVHVGRGKWKFSARGIKTIRKDGTPVRDGVSLEKYEKVGGRENAEAYAKILAASVKRNNKTKTGILDGLANSQIEKLLSPIVRHFKGIDFAQTVPANNAAAFERGLVADSIRQHVFGQK